VANPKSKREDGGLRIENGKISSRKGAKTQRTQKKRQGHDASLSAFAKASASGAGLLCSPNNVICFLVKTASFNALKQQKTRARMAALRQARRSSRTAAKIQRRVSLVGDGAKWRITNLNRVARAIAKWR
jgi:hypothetical protein